MSIYRVHDTNPVGDEREEKDLFLQLRKVMTEEAKEVKHRSTRRGFMQHLVSFSMAGFTGFVSSQQLYAGGECGPADNCTLYYNCSPQNICQGDNSCTHNGCSSSAYNLCIASNSCSRNQCDDLNQCKGNACSPHSNICYAFTNTCLKSNICTGGAAGGMGNSCTQSNVCEYNICEIRNVCVSNNLCDSNNQCDPLSNYSCPQAYIVFV